MENSRIQIWTDGASRGNPGPASWACHCPGLQGFQFVGGSLNSTNNRMEMTAIIEALKGVMALEEYPDECDTIEINSDSSYSVNTFRQWIWSWVKNKNIHEKKNPDLLNEYLLLHTLLRNDEWVIKFNHVNGHAGDKNNNEADRLCNSFLDGDLNPKSAKISINRLAFWMSKIPRVIHAWYHPDHKLIVLEIEDSNLWECQVMSDANLLAELFPVFNVCVLKSDYHPSNNGFIHE